MKPGIKVTGRTLLVISTCSRVDALRRHLPWAVLSGLPLLLSFVFPLDRFTESICVFRRLTGHPCLTCGMTRAFCGIAHGNPGSALVNCPVSVPLYLVLVVVFSVNLSGVVVGRCVYLGEGWRPGRRGWRRLIAFCFVVFILNWVYRLCMGFV